jgi:hypothetical protein
VGQYTIITLEDHGGGQIYAHSQLMPTLETGVAFLTERCNQTVENRGYVAGPGTGFLTFW